MEKKPPLVSIGIPVYNAEKYLNRALDSLLAQSFTDFELVISDNASTDDTEAICRHYAAKDTRIRYVRAKANEGLPWNFNRVLELARGEYFMWAASDDQWAMDFIHSLLEPLERNPSAIGAFPPYQLVEEETGIHIKRIWCFSYENHFTFFRLLKFSWYYDDAYVYGLMRREHLNKINFQPWVWINANTPYNIAYPIIYFLLSRGNLLLVGERPLWFKSITTSHGHSTPFKANPLLAYLSHIVRKINLFVRSTRYIYLGSESILLTLSTVPFLLLRFFIDCITPIYAVLYLWFSGKKISQTSPHEIWQLGVR